MISFKLGRYDMKPSGAQTALFTAGVGGAFYGVKKKRAAFTVGGAALAGVVAFNVYTAAKKEHDAALAVATANMLNVSKGGNVQPNFSNVKTGSSSAFLGLDS